MSVDILGTSCDQCRSMVQYGFTSKETKRLVRTDSPGRPPRLSHSSWTMRGLGQWKLAWDESLCWLQRERRRWSQKRPMNKENQLGYTDVQASSWKTTTDDHSTAKCTFWSAYDLPNVHFDKHKICQMYILISLWSAKCTFWSAYDLPNVHFDQHKICQMYILISIRSAKCTFW